MKWQVLGELKYDVIDYNIVTGEKNATIVDQRYVDADTDTGEETLSDYVDGDKEKALFDKIMGIDIESLDLSKNRLKYNIDGDKQRSMKLLSQCNVKETLMSSVFDFTMAGFENSTASYNCVGGTFKE
ncbi:MAG: hypothetical protein IKQ71_03415 [Lachnospiraceae bacterium]|nr:hypothetical protein [Lachnospiraceae bacterium]